MPRLDGVFGPLPADVDRYSALDGLRGVAIILLFMGHYREEWLRLPFVGSIVFPADASIVALFVLTGFLVTQRFLTEWDAKGDFRIIGYFARKVVRFYPAFVVFVMFTVFHQVLNGGTVPLARVLSVLGLVGNYYYALAQTDDGRFSIGHLWSVAVGAHFLVVWPWILRASLRAGNLKGLIGSVVVLVLGGMTLRTALHWFTDVSVPYKYLATENRVDALLIGSLLALVLRDPVTARRLRWLTTRSVFPWCATAALLMSIWSDGWYRRGPGYSFEAMIIALLVVLAISSERTRELAWLRSWPLRGLSAISFSVFLWHRYPLAVDTKLSALPVSLLLPLTMLLTVLVGAVSYLVLERPFLILARRMSARARELAKA